MDIDNFYYILRKNDVLIYSGEDYNEMNRKVPRHKNNHNGDIYDLFCLSFYDDRIVISYGKNVGRYYTDSSLDSGKWGSLRLPMKSKDVLNDLEMMVSKAHEALTLATK